MAGYVVRFDDLKRYARGQRRRPRQRSMWDRLVLILFSAPERVWSTAELKERLYRDDPDGGPLCNAMHVIIHRHRGDLPPGWRLERSGYRGYKLAFGRSLTTPRIAGAAHARPGAAPPPPG